MYTHTHTHTPIHIPSWWTCLFSHCPFFSIWNIYFLLKYNWLTVFQVHSKVIQLYIYIVYIIFQIIFHYRLLQNIDYSFPCYTVNLCCLCCISIFFWILDIRKRRIIPQQFRNSFYLGFPTGFWRQAWQPIPVFLPGKYYGQRSLAGYSPWGRKESDMTEATEHAHTGF